MDQQVTFKLNVKKILNSITLAENAFHTKYFGWKIVLPK